MKSIDELAGTLRHFARDRDWEQYHSPKNLAMALSVEVAELVEHFQWLTQDESLHLPAEKKEEVGDELADVFIYLVRLADRLNIDLLGAAEQKIKKNTRKYPAPENMRREEKPASPQEKS